MVMRNTIPGDEVIITTNGETMACKVVKVMGKDGTFEEPTVPKGQIGDIHVKITINKGELLRDLGDISKSASIARDKVLEKLRELLPPIGVIPVVRYCLVCGREGWNVSSGICPECEAKREEKDEFKTPPRPCCERFAKMVMKGVFGGNDNCRDGSMWVLADHLKSRMTCCPFCGKKL